MDKYITKPLLMGLGLIVAILILDQASKSIIFNMLVVEGAFYETKFARFPAGQTIEVFPFFNLVIVWNPGVSFGMFNSLTYSHLIFSSIAIIVSIGLLIWMWQMKNNWQIVAISCIVGGALGNTVDRLRFQAVFDFLDFHLFGYHWPAFNVADSTIFIGAVILVIDSFIGVKKDEHSKDN